MGHYIKFAIETFRNPGEPSAERVRARPLPGQGLDSNIRVSCSSRMRLGQPVGSYILIDAQVTHSASGATFLYAKPNSDYEVISLDAANRHVLKTFGPGR